MLGNEERRRRYNHILDSGRQGRAYGSDANFFAERHLKTKKDFTEVLFKSSLKELVCF